MQLSMSSRRRGGGGGILIDRFGPGVGHLNYLVVPGVGILIISWGGEFQLYLTSHICPGVGNFIAIFLENVKIQPYAPAPPTACIIGLIQLNLQLLIILYCPFVILFL